MSKVALIILDGFGHSDHKEHNAIALAKTPFIDSILQNYPHSLLETSGEAVGLPEGVMGNSEVGHLTIGAGRVIYQDLTRIDRFMKNEGFDTIKNLHQVTQSPAIHLMGLFSDGGVHSHLSHLYGLLDFYNKKYSQKKIYLHLFMDGRDTPPKNGIDYIKKLEAYLADKPNIKISTVIGRFYAMDRDKRWDRVKLAYDAMALSDGTKAQSASMAVSEAYAAGENDEFIKPRVIAGGKNIDASDAVVFFNFRADRAREISQAFGVKSFNEFPCPVKVETDNWICFSPYSEDFTFPCLFTKEDLSQILPEVVANHKLKQLRIAETEKYAHVTYFFSGGKEAIYPNEDRVLVDSPRDVETYDKKPEMSARSITEKLVNAIDSNKYDLIVCNYANGDMVGHTGIEPAAIQAVEVLDACLKEVCESALKSGYDVLISADHGNCEEMLDAKTGEPMTQHSTNPVPLIWVGKDASGKKLVDGSLVDIAPTVLDILNIPKPGQMTGVSLIKK
ncbi:MAG: 2,3-bisphosphoglycerate-independent phosphoglycerate mutase [Bdellovibrionales bacterium]|nr:2,3-bisphosphoglycerate-independent phosphoglycerate mutase [Bdellovibrionales bacterium]